MADKKEVKPEDKKPHEYFAKWDSAEITKDQVVSYSPNKDGSSVYGAYPSPANRFRVILEGPNVSIEGLYFWCLTQFRMIGFPVVEKINDVFSASESSSLFGASQQRLGLTQDRVMQFLRVIHDMVRSIPPYVREIRVINERLDYYNNSELDSALGEASEKTLKGLYVDLVEGGAKSPASVFGLSQQVGFAILPNLFFETRKAPKEDLDRFMERVKKMSTEFGGDFPKDPVTVLQRKMTQYYTWKTRTKEELTRRRTYLLKYLRQYYSTIKLYMQWVKPYLKTVKRMGMDLNNNSRPELVKAFETSLVEIEILGRKAVKDSKHDSCILMTFQYRTKPSMSMTTPDFQHRGPVHVGEAEVTWRSYAWSEQDIKKFKQLKDQEDLDLLKNIDETLKLSLEGVEEDLSKFLEQADVEAFGKKEAPKKEDRPQQSIFEPVVAIIKGTKETADSLIGGGGDIIRAFFPEEKKAGPDAKAAIGGAKFACFLHYKNFKKSYGLAAW